MLKFNPFWIIITLMSSLFISACSNQEYIIICDYPMRAPEEIQTVISDDEKIVLNFPSFENENLYSEEIYHEYAKLIAELHCSEFEKISKLKAKNTNEGLTSLSFGCIKH
jgi:hypothetical protein